MDPSVLRQIAGLRRRAAQAGVGFDAARFATEAPYSEQILQALLVGEHDSLWCQGLNLALRLNHLSLDLPLPLEKPRRQRTAAAAPAPAVAPDLPGRYLGPLRG